MRKSSHSITALTYHIVIVTKYRKPILVGEVEETVKSECKRIIKHFEGEVLEMETDIDHIHLVVELPPKFSVSEVMNVLKGVSARMVRKEHEEEIKKTLRGKTFWSPSYYAATTGGVTLETIKQYVESQKEPEHRNRRS